MRHVRWLAFLVAVAVLPACGGRSRPSIVQPVFFNAPDSFALEQGARNYSTYHVEFWDCSEPQANLILTEGITAGSIHIEILDDTGFVVHDNEYEGFVAGPIEAVTAPDGVPGIWTIRITCNSATWGGDIYLDADLFLQQDEIWFEGPWDCFNTLYYEVGWTAGPADIFIAGPLETGSVRVRVRDGMGSLIHDVTIVAPYGGIYDVLTASGSGGLWTVEIDVFGRASSGAINVSHP